MKDAGVERVPEALRWIASGDRYASAVVQAALFQEFVGGAKLRPDRDPLATLSARELQVFRLVGAGCTLGHIARELRLSVKTVGTHRERLKDKLGLASARELERYAGELVRAGRM